MYTTYVADAEDSLLSSFQQIWKICNFCKKNTSYTLKTGKNKEILTKFCN